MIRRIGAGLAAFALTTIVLSASGAQAAGVAQAGAAARAPGVPHRAGGGHPAGGAAGGVTVTYRVFPGGRQLLPMEVVKRGTLIDPAAATLPGKAPKIVFEFLFWDINGRLDVGRTIKTPPAGGGARSFATAWYLRTGTGGTGGCGTGCAVGTWAFSLKTDSVMKGVTPIGSVTPAGLWSSPSTSVSTMTSSGSVTISAVASTSPPSPAANFVRWLELPNTAVPGASFSVPANSDALAIAFYSPTTPRQPPPNCKTPRCM